MKDILIGAIFLVLAVRAYFIWKHSTDKEYLWFAICFSAAFLMKLWNYLDHRVLHLPATVLLIFDTLFLGISVAIVLLSLKMAIIWLRKFWKHRGASGVDASANVLK
jgi:hypothetical protein